MDSLKELLQKKIDGYDDSTADDLHTLKAIVKKMYGTSASVYKLDGKGTATITTQSAAVAGDLRLKQMQILILANKKVDQKLTRLNIRIQA